MNKPRTLYRINLPDPETEHDQDMLNMGREAKGKIEGLLSDDYLVPVSVDDLNLKAVAQILAADDDWDWIEVSNELREWYLASARGLVEVALGGTDE